MSNLLNHIKGGKLSSDFVKFLQINKVKVDDMTEDEILSLEFIYLGGQSVAKKLLELFMFRVDTMVQAQKEYFKSRSDSRLKTAKLHEEKVNKALQELRSRGYSTAAHEQKANPGQAGLFS